MTPDYTVLTIIIEKITYSKIQHNTSCTLFTYLLMKSCKLKDKEDDTCSAVVRFIVEMYRGRSKDHADARTSIFRNSIHRICE